MFVCLFVCLVVCLSVPLGGSPTPLASDKKNLWGGAARGGAAREIPPRGGREEQKKNSFGEVLRAGLLRAGARCDPVPDVG